MPPRAPKGLLPSSWLTAAAAGLFVTPAHGHGQIRRNSINTLLCHTATVCGAVRHDNLLACLVISYGQRTRNVAATQLAAAARVLDLAQQLRGPCDLGGCCVRIKQHPEIQLYEIA